MKVVYNGSYGGFSLSRQAVLRAREISNDPNWGGPCLKGDTYKNGDLVQYDFGFADEVKRHDPVLVQVVEELGEAASGRAAFLTIQELPDKTPYRITEYDGWETVETPDDLEWIIT